MYGPEWTIAWNYKNNYSKYFLWIFLRVLTTYRYNSNEAILVFGDNT